MLAEFQAQHDLARTLHSDVALTPYVQLPASLVLVLPLAQLPYIAAYVVMSLLNVALVVAAVGLLVERRGLGRAQRALLWPVGVSSLPLLISVYQAQTIPFVLFATALAIRAATFRPGTAGVALAVAGLRYHVVLGVVGALVLVRPRVIAGFAGGLAALGLLSVAVVGGDFGGLASSLKFAHANYDAVGYAVPGLVRVLPGPVRYPVWGIAAVGVLVLAMRAARRHADRPGAAALAGGTAWLMVAPFLYPHDLALLPLLCVAALAEAWSVGPARGLGVAVAVLFCVLEGVVVFGGAALVAVEGAILCLLALGTLNVMSYSDANASVLTVQ
jgi:Glycosyltransferase family 87